MKETGNYFAESAGKEDEFLGPSSMVCWVFRGDLGTRGLYIQYFF